MLFAICVAWFAMSICVTTPYGPGSEPPHPKKCLSCTCPLWHLEDLEVVPHPTMLSSINSSRIARNGFEIQPPKPRFDLRFTIYFNYFTKK